MRSRQLYLPAGRFERWWERFTAEHPGVEVSFAAGQAILTSTDGSVARFSGWYPVTAADPRSALQRAPREIGIILLRRGGYSIGYVSGGELTGHKSGTRYVQGRTAAGGWSQQRFARRRQNQADELVQTAAGVAARILAPLVGSTEGGLFVGGDEFLLTELLGDVRLEGLANLPRRVVADIPDPRFAVLSEAVGWARAVSVVVTNP